MENPKIIQTIDLTKVYGKRDAEVLALDQVTLDIRPGEFVAVMGPSGSGKSTLMNILGCLDRPTSGSYFLGGEDVSQLDKDRLAMIRGHYIGFVFQSYNLLARTSSLENVMLPMIYSRLGRLTEAEQRRRAWQVLEMVGLTDRARHQPHELSGGQRQRVAIARALVNEPALILADEPTGNLDSRSGDEIMAILSGLNQQGISIVLVTHEDQVASYAQRVVRFRDGRIESDLQNGHHNQVQVHQQEAIHEPA
jgi:putative ABC transport system ATP-binding protein